MRTIGKNITRLLLVQFAQRRRRGASPLFAKKINKISAK
jgi:hypothetical protein